MRFIVFVVFILLFDFLYLKFLLLVNFLLLFLLIVVSEGEESVGLNK